MRLLVFGTDVNFQELTKKLGENDGFTYAPDVHFYDGDLQEYDLILDFTFDEQPEVIELYKDVNGPLILLNNVKSTLAELWFVSGGWTARIGGFNGLPGFVDRALWEVTSMEEHPDFGELNSLGIDWEHVEDRVGMVAPRVICMIINEAFFTVEEGTSDRESIDLAMKLGTGYPQGPFEWAEKIGISHVYETLTALFEDTGDQRYRVCPELKRCYLSAQ